MPSYAVQVITDTLSENPGQVRQYSDRSKADHEELDGVVEGIRCEGVEVTAEFARGVEAPEHVLLGAECNVLAVKDFTV